MIITFFVFLIRDVSSPMEHPIVLTFYADFDITEFSIGIVALWRVVEEIRRQKRIKSHGRPGQGKGRRR